MFETGSKMTHPFVIIDGYNLMHAMGLARRSYGPGDLQTSRNRLLQQLADRLSDSAKQRTTVVFDAFGSDDNSHRQQSRKGIDVVYAPAGTDADGELERMIAAHSAPRQLLVVSSDHRLHRAAGRRRARAIDSDVFWDSLDAGIASSRNAQGKPRSPQDTAFWLNEFTDITAEHDGVSSAEDDVFDSEYLSDLESEFGA